ncbi:MAG TPA: DUF998 domain-containing protein [Ktedonobacterales bacterium]|jgi:hypothetical protein
MENTAKSPLIANRSSPAPYGLGNGTLSSLMLGLVSCGGIGALLFTAIYLIEGATRPGYDAWQQPISTLSLGPGGWAQQVNFVVYGALLVLSAVGWYRFLSPVRGAIWFPLLQGIGGLCLIGAGVFSTDPFPGYSPGARPGTPTLHGTLHGIFAWVLILTLAMSCFALAILVRSAHVSQWRGWYVYSLVTGILILIFWGAFLDGASGQIAGLVLLAGLAERLSAMSHDLWLCVLTAALVVQHWRRSRYFADSESSDGSR